MLHKIGDFCIGSRKVIGKGLIDGVEDHIIFILDS